MGTGVVLPEDGGRNRHDEAGGDGGGGKLERGSFLDPFTNLEERADAELRANGYRRKRESLEELRETRTDNSGYESTGFYGGVRYVVFQSPGVVALSLPGKWRVTKLGASTTTQISDESGTGTEVILELIDE